MNKTRADSFLRLIRCSQRGRLKIYMGYCAGVGKTYEMLLEAHRLKRDGIDIVVGVVETHGRTETEALLANLEILPRKRVVHRGIEIGEMDLEAILARRPGVVLVDELAHTNVPGSKNSKRYQDVDEILAAGIHVISTLNVQHLESLYETVERATGVKVRERIPDRVVAEADQLVNVDVTTEDLRARLAEGKVYTTDRIDLALTHFFKETNLQQLRELTLREIAAQIDSRRRDPLAEETPSSPDQLMVCLSSKGPNCEALLRYTSRLAGRLNRHWYAVHVQTPSEDPTAIDATTQRILANTLTLAQELGATVFTYRGGDVVKTILQFAQEYRVGHIVIGTPGQEPPFWRRCLGQVDVVGRLIRESRGITVIVLDTREIGQKNDWSMAPTELPVEKRNDHPKQTSTPPTMPAWMTDLAVILWDNPMDKNAAIAELVEACRAKTTGLAENALTAVMERENQGSTFVGEDVAIPHARIEGADLPRVALGIGKAGIHDATAGRGVRIMFLLLSPIDNPHTHVAMLASISRMARDDRWRNELLATTTPSAVMRLVQAQEGGA